MSDPCILIVEQDLLVRTPLAEYLRECGYLMLEASSAGDARTLLEDGSRRVDCPRRGQVRGAERLRSSELGANPSAQHSGCSGRNNRHSHRKGWDICQEGDPPSPSLMTTASCWTISNVSSPQGTGMIAPDAESGRRQRPGISTAVHPLPVDEIATAQVAALGTCRRHLD
jgi:hypothetical protein